MKIDKKVIVYAVLELTSSLVGWMLGVLIVGHWGGFADFTPGSIGIMILTFLLGRLVFVVRETWDKKYKELLESCKESPA